MSKVSIEQQIAELTPEQKANMGKLFKKYIAGIVVVCLVAILAAGGLFVETSLRLEKAEERYERISTEIELNAENNTYDLSLFDEKREALDEYYDIKEERLNSLYVGCAIAFFGVIVIEVIYRKKYPYFSEKKYAYLKKMQNNANV